MMEPRDLARAIRRSGGRLAAAGSELRVWAAPEPLVDEATAKAPALLRWLMAEQVLIDRWVTDKVLAVSEHCQHCKKTFCPGDAFADVRGGDGVGRFHRDCLSAWREGKAREARKVLGFE
jgi:hypothetical protein